MRHDTITIPRRFCGPPESGNGGYVCGRLAGYLPGSVAVRLMAPPPLETALKIEADGTKARMLHNGVVIAAAATETLDIAPPVAPSFMEAQTASRSYAGFDRHSFPNCFVCGPGRATGDGLRIFAGALGSQRAVAAPWVPDPSLTDADGHIGTEFLWAALDCPGAFAMPIPEPGITVVLGELCARINTTVAPHERCVVIGWPLHKDGRKRHVGTAVYAADGRLVAIGRATWIEVPVAAFGGR